MSRSCSSTREPVVACRGVTKKYYFYHHRTTTLREWFIRSLLGKPMHTRRPVFTLDGLDLTVERGESVALIGPNGSGKSTALRMIAGIYRPTSGSVVTRGHLAAVIELGAGFNPELTGAENVRLYGTIMGLSRGDIARRYAEIVEFAGVGDYIDVPAKYFSSGMQARLAFSIAICVNPDVLLLDEVLAVGDGEFQRKCLDRLAAFHQASGTLIIASHALETIRRMCGRAIWLDRGRVRMAGDADQVIDAYALTCRGSSRVEETATREALTS